MFIYSVFDKKGQFHRVQFFAERDAEAVRAVSRQVNTSGSDYNMFPDDFALYCVGEFNTDNGIVSGINPIRFVVNFESLIRVADTCKSN